MIRIVFLFLIVFSVMAGEDYEPKPVISLSPAFRGVWLVSAVKIRDDPIRNLPVAKEMGRCTATTFQAVYNDVVYNVVFQRIVAFTDQDGVLFNAGFHDPADETTCVAFCHNPKTNICVISFIEKGKTRLMWRGVVQP